LERHQKEKTLLDNTQASHTPSRRAAKQNHEVRRKRRDYKINNKYQEKTRILQEKAGPRGERGATQEKNRTGQGKTRNEKKEGRKDKK
jgi:hypothetical protein